MPGRSTFTATACGRRRRLRRDAPARSRRPRPPGRTTRRRLAQRLAERGRDRGFGLGLRERRHPVLQAFEIARERDADDVRPRREELAELHISRAEPGQRGGEPTGAGRAVGRSISRASRKPSRAGARQRRRIDQAEHALAREHEAGARQAEQMRRSAAITTASRNAAPRCRRSSRDATRARSRPRASSRRTRCGRGKLRIDSTR